MSTSISVFVFFGVIQVILSQENTNGPPFTNPIIPRECWGPPKGTNVFQCCPLPVMFSADELKTCNMDKERSTGGRRRAECPQELCLLRNRGILLDDDTIDYEKMKAFLSQWAEDKPYLHEGIKVAKDLCFDGNSHSRRGEPAYCEPDKLFDCITGAIIWNCKLSTEPPSCKILKVHMDECRPYLYKHPQV